MRLVFSFVVVIALLLGLPAAYFYFASPSDAAFAEVSVGDSEATVLALLGKPRRIERKAPYLRGATLEYEYYVYPNPVLWCVGFKDGVVVEKAVMSSP